MSVIDIDDDRRQQVAFRIDQPVGIRLWFDGGTPRGAVAQTCAPPVAIDWLLSRGENSHRDLRSIAVKRLPHEIRRFIHNVDNGARLSIGMSDIAAINPEMSLTDPFCSTV